MCSWQGIILNRFLGHICNLSKEQDELAVKLTHQPCSFWTLESACKGHFIRSTCALWSLQAFILSSFSALIFQFLCVGLRML